MKLLRTDDDVEPSKSDCSRAVSTLYYALFDAVCTAVANRVAGRQIDGQRPSQAWINIYRAMDHRSVRDTLFSVTRADKADSSNEYAFVAITFNKLLEHREEADYDRRKDFDPIVVNSLSIEVYEAVSMLEGEGNHRDVDITSSFSNLIVALLLPKPKR